MGVIANLLLICVVRLILYCYMPLVKRIHPGQQQVANAFNSGDSFGYQMGDVYGTFSGSLAAGETVIIDSLMNVAIFGPGWELGVRAFIGDPNDLSTTPGFSGGFTTASVSPVPVPAAAWLFGTGLLGLFSALQDVENYNL